MFARALARVLDNGGALFVWGLQALQLYFLTTSFMMFGHNMSLRVPAFTEGVLGLPKNWPHCLPTPVLPPAFGKLFGKDTPDASGIVRDNPIFINGNGLVDPGPPPPPRSAPPSAEHAAPSAAAAAAAAGGGASARAAPLPSFVAVGPIGVAGTYPAAPAAAPVVVAAAAAAPPVTRPLEAAVAAVVGGAAPAAAAAVHAGRSGSGVVEPAGAAAAAATAAAASVKYTKKNKWHSPPQKAKK